MQSVRRGEGFPLPSRAERDTGLFTGISSIKRKPSFRGLWSFALMGARQIHRAKPSNEFMGQFDWWPDGFGQVGMI